LQLDVFAFVRRIGIDIRGGQRMRRISEAAVIFHCLEYAVDLVPLRMIARQIKISEYMVERAVLHVDDHDVMDARQIHRQDGSFQKHGGAVSKFLHEKSTRNSRLPLFAVPRI